MREQDFNQLWEDNGNSNFIKSFFLGPQIEIAQKEHIKQLALEKLANEKAANSNSQTITTHFNNNQKVIANSRNWLKTLWWRWQWKLALPVVVLIFLSMIGSQLLPQLTQRSFDSSIGISLSKKMPTMDQQNAVAGGSPMMSDIAPSLPSSKGKPENTTALDARQSSDLMTGAGNNLPGPIPPVTTVPPADPNFTKKITHNLNATLQVSNITDTINRLNQDFQQMGGYVVNSQQNGGESGGYGHINAKIPAAKFESFRTSLPNIGKILSQNQTANDITNQYYDAQTRLQNWEAEQLRYMDILKQAKNVQDILQVEGALANIRQQIEQLKGQLKLWNNEVDYSTIQLELQSTNTPDLQVSDPWQPVSWLKTWKATQDAVLKTMSSTWNALNYGLVGLGYAFPYLIVLGIIYTGYRLLKKRQNSVSK